MDQLNHPKSGHNLQTCVRQKLLIAERSYGPKSFLALLDAPWKS